MTLLLGHRILGSHVTSGDSEMTRELGLEEEDIPLSDLMIGSGRYPFGNKIPFLSVNSNGPSKEFVLDISFALPLHPFEVSKKKPVMRSGRGKKVGKRAHLFNCPLQIG